MWLFLIARIHPMQQAKVVQLPRGKHGLSREEVHFSQRLRMLTAMGAAIGEKGYAATSVADVIRGAGVSRETFYEHFANKEACFLAAFDAGVDSLATTMRSALGDEGDEPLERLDRAVGAYLDALAHGPAFARAFLIEVYAAGPDAIARRMELQQRFVDTVAGVLHAQTEDDRFACEALVAALGAMVTGRVAAGNAAALPQLREPIMGLVGRLGVAAP
jgi:AcrR family transcriptional regulator